MAQTLSYSYGAIVDSVMTRWRMAKSVNTPTAVLEKLAEDEDLWVRRAVAENPATPSEALARLAEDPDAETRRNVEANTALDETFRVVVPGRGWWFLIASAVAVGVIVGAAVVWLIALLVLGGVGAALAGV